MTNTYYKNEVAKRKYFGYLAGPKGFSKTTVICYEKAILLWEDFTGREDFRLFNKTKAEGFKEWLKNKKVSRSEEPVSLSYRYDMLRFLKSFFEWLCKQKGYRKIDPTDVDYLTLSKGDARIATQPRGVKFPTFDEINSAIDATPANTEVGMRNRALLSLIFLTGARISAVLSLSLQNFDRANLTIDQDPTMGVKTKFSKPILTRLIGFPNTNALSYFTEWFEYLQQKGFKANDPLFPSAKVGRDEKTLGYFKTDEVEPVFWKTCSSARKIFAEGFRQAGIRYYHPHTFRHAVVSEVSKLPLTEEVKKAISQNFGHESVGTTFGSHGYGHIATDRQIELIKKIDFTGKKQESGPGMSDDDIEKLAQKLKEKGI